VNLQVNERGGMSFDVLAHPAETPLARVELQVPGEHNVCNALGVLAVHHALGHSLEQASHALSSYTGSGRRFEVIGEVDGITIVDDYAHHPSKIKATLAAARSRYPQRRVVAVWQPHTYSRILALQDEFVQSFRDADMLIVTDIYASREKPQSYSVENLVNRITYVPAFHISANPQVTDYLLKHLVPGDVLIVLSAGDADQVCRDVMQGLKERIG
jgi:UDP-N-acetylmuramate--alanine ligase